MRESHLCGRRSHFELVLNPSEVERNSVLGKNIGGVCSKRTGSNNNEQAILSGCYGFCECVHIATILSLCFVCCKPIMGPIPIPVRGYRVQARTKGVIRC